MTGDSVSLSVSLDRRMYTLCVSESETLQPEASSLYLSPRERKRLPGIARHTLISGTVKVESVSCD